ncbi:alpha-hydroxy acid oxidase [Comamonas terrigena]|uniref:alpha-hydroxy acid oxidase n=1 Tax=Comamonas terrigena TaxID=32013 RepID=UPI00244695F0|nr:alpha-hydroxy acid oxidase [Comamonas terrigena]MDH0050525.1 alpha-hydroxy-acid oxidizing protein [Comamonas terrigena]MDH0512997.1 alpha-hydroxy-acid oxidizing protein [Comamonas terrigena]MDH1092399.1 alpha-hydroxy-acid oxidizing protein [Comamonas terrigena]MDH1502645.1 alpha-hydroxy-acid oxidizing protein [Comamonas terrigena]
MTGTPSALSPALNALGQAVQPTLSRIPSGIGALADYARQARHHIEAHAWAHIESGCDQAHALAHNRQALDGIRLLPEPLPDLSQAHTGLQLLGQAFDWPVLLAPVAYHRLAHPEGEIASVRAAMAMRTGMVVSTLSSYTLEEIAQAAAAAFLELSRTAPLWFQLYSQPDRQHTLSLVRRAEAAGYQALVWTVDANIKRSGYPLPPGVEAVNLRGMPQPQQTGDLMDDHILFGTPLATGAPRWSDLEWLRAHTHLPLIVKGILSPRAARQAVALGADAIVVSNHGGRVLDAAVSPIDVLADVRQAVGPQLPLLLDSGIRQGTDVLKALALGANAVLIGRPQLHSLAVAGTLGTAHMLYLLRSELELAMAQTGCAQLQQIGADLLWQPR